MLVVVCGLLCLTVKGASSQTFEQQVFQISQRVSVDAQQMQNLVAQADAVQRGGVSISKPTDALDETKVGVAAKFIAIQPGTFVMGSPADEEGREYKENLHSVTLTRGFEMQATEVTQLQYFLVMGRNPSGFRKEKYCEDTFKAVYGLGLCINHPVERVSWDNAQKFIERLNQTQNQHIYRLPTEAEWEYAARGGTPSGFPYSFGYNDTDLLDSHGWYDGNSDSRTHATASKKVNPFGLHDMHGNVGEWVQDFYGNYPTIAVTDPTSIATGGYRVIRGGSWYGNAERLRSASRHTGFNDYRSSSVGFRLVRSPR